MTDAAILATVAWCRQCADPAVRAFAESLLPACARVKVRDDHLRAAGAALGNVANVPAELARRMDSYSRRAWIKHRDLAECPATLDGEVEAHLWAALRIDDRVMSERHLRRILGGDTSDVEMSTRSP
jgi:hypothetical protein